MTTFSPSSLNNILWNKKWVWWKIRHWHWATRSEKAHTETFRQPFYACIFHSIHHRLPKTFTFRSLADYGAITWPWRNSTQWKPVKSLKNQSRTLFWHQSETPTKRHIKQTRGIKTLLKKGTTGCNFKTVKKSANPRFPSDKRGHQATVGNKRRRDWWNVLRCFSLASPKC